MQVGSLGAEDLTPNGESDFPPRPCAACPRVRGRGAPALCAVRAYGKQAQCWASDLDYRGAASDLDFRGASGYFMCREGTE